MNILFICDEYPPGKNGGIGTMVQTLARELARQGHRIYVAGLYSYRYGEADYEEDGSVKVWRLRYGVKLPVSPESRLYALREKLPAFIQKKLHGEKAFVQFTRFIEKLITSEHIDIIEMGDFNNFCSHIGFIVKWPAFKVPLVVKIHGSHSYFASEMHTTLADRYKQTDRALYERADAISAVSRYAAGVTQGLFEIKKNIRILYNATMPCKKHADDRLPYTVIFTGSLAHKKGIFQLMKAWNIVSAQIPEARLVIYGKGKVQALQALLLPQAMDTVIFKGHVSQQALTKALSEATLGVLPSYSETFGLAVIEAMNTGCPVIYTKRSCGPEIVEDGVTGLLADPDQIEDMAQLILRLLKNPAERKKIGSAGYEYVRAHFMAEDSAKQHINFYTETIRNFQKA